jgi:hypothetical protein
MSDFFPADGHCDFSAHLVGRIAQMRICCVVVVVGDIAYRPESFRIWPQ